MEFKKNLIDCTKNLDTLTIKVGLISAILDYIGYGNEERVFALSVKTDYDDFVELYGKQTAARILSTEKVHFVIGGNNFYSNPLDKDICTEHEIMKLTDSNINIALYGYLDLLQDNLEQQIEDGEWNDFLGCPKKMADRLDSLFNGCIDFHKALGTNQTYRVRVSFDIDVDADNDVSAFDMVSKNIENVLPKSKHIMFTIC